MTTISEGIRETMKATSQLSTSKSTATARTSTCSIDDASVTLSISGGKRPSSFLHDAVLSSGDDFYDDGYNETELETGVPFTLLNGNDDGDGDGDGGLSSFYGRDTELRILHRVYNRMMEVEATAHGALPSPPPSMPTPTATKTSRPPTATPCNVVKEDTPFLPAVFVWGTSGTGKSQLVDTFCHQLLHGSNSPSNIGDNTTTRQQQQQEHKHKRKLHVLRGKFEEHQQNDPFSAIVQAFSDWCNGLSLATAAGRDSGKANAATTSNNNSRSNNNNESSLLSELERLRSTINTSQMMPQQKALLMSFVPALSVLFHTDSHSNDADDATASISTSQRQDALQEPSSDTSSWSRFQYTFTQFLTTISSKECPLVMVLDDMQWASQETMDLMSSTLHQPHFLLIGTIRQDVNPHSPGELLELHPDLPLMKLLNDIQGSRSQDEAEGTAQTNKRTANNTSGGSNGSCAVPYTNIHLGDFTRQELREWVTHLFLRNDKNQERRSNRNSDSNSNCDANTNENEDNSHIEKVTDFLYKQTRGNIFHAIQLLQDMERNNVLVYSRISFQWEFNDDPTKSGGNGATFSQAGPRDVIHLVTSKVKALPRPLQKVLIIASYIRSSFDSNLLQIILGYEEQHNHGAGDILDEIGNGGIVGVGSGDSDNSSSGGASHMNSSEVADRPLSEWLEQGVLEGLLHNSIGETTYRFAHDRIQQAAHDIVPFGEVRTKLRLRIGRCIWDLCTKTSSHIKDTDSADTSTLHTPFVDDAGLLFIAAEHLNCAPTKDHLLSAQQNLMAGEHALHMAALVPAATYLHTATTALRKVRGDPWRDHYDLTLRLIRARSGVELSLGNFDVGQSLCNEVLERAKSIGDKLPTYLSLAHALGRQDEHVKALDLIKRSAQLCRIYPKRAFFFHSIRQLLSARSYFGRTTDEEFLRQCPITTDPQSLLRFNLLSGIILRALFCKDTTALLLGIVRVIHVTRTLGSCRPSAFALVMFGMLHNKLGEYANARRYSNLAKEIIRREHPNDQSSGGIYQLSASCIDAYSQPPEAVAADFQYAYKSCMSSGDFEGGILCHNSCTMYAYTQGYPLGILLPIVNSIFDQMKMYKINAHTQLILEYTNTIKRMAGVIDINWDELMELKQYEQGDPLRRWGAYWGRLYLAVYFGKYEHAETVYRIMVANAADDPSYTFQTTLPLLGGLMAANQYRRTGKKEFMQILRQTKKDLKKICDAKGKNAMNRYLLLRAELQSIKRSSRTPMFVLQCYNETIKVAKKSSQVNEAGLACELAGEHVLSLDVDFTDGDGNDWARHYFTQAMEFYEAWGATAKCDDLRERRSSYIDEIQVQDARKRNTMASQAVSFGGKKSLVANYELVTVCSPSQGMVDASVSKGSRNSGVEYSENQTTKRASNPSMDVNSEEGDIDDDLSVLTDRS